MPRRVAGGAEEAAFTAAIAHARAAIQRPTVSRPCVPSLPQLAVRSLAERAQLERRARMIGVPSPIVVIESCKSRLPRERLRGRP